MIPRSKPVRGNSLCRPEASWLGRTSILPTLLFLLLGAAPSISSAASPQKPLKDQLVGTWTLVSISDDSRNKDKRNLSRPSAKFITTFAPDGRVTCTVTAAVTVQEPNGKPRPDNIRTVAFSGTYSVDEADRTVTYQSERGSLSSLGATDPKANVTIKGNQFEQVSHPVGSSATMRAVWQRVK